MSPTAQIMKFFIKLGHNEADGSSGYGRDGHREGRGSFPRPGNCKTKDRPSGSYPLSPPTRRQPCQQAASQMQLAARREPRRSPPAPGLNRPRRPSRLLHRLAGARYHGDGHRVYITLRRPCAPNTCCHHGVTDSNSGGGKQAYVRLFTRGGERLPAAPVRLQLPGWILQPAARKVRANDRASAQPETPLSRVTFDSRSDRPWLRHLSFQRRAFRRF